MRSKLDCRVSSDQISSLATRSPEEKRNAESPYTHIRTTSQKLLSLCGKYEVTVRSDDQEIKAHINLERNEENSFLIQV